jgi:hypothetical protein
MDAQPKTAFNLTRYELWYLISLISPATVIGFRNPTAGMLVEDMFPLMQEASFSLLDKDLIYADSNSQIKIKKDLERLIYAVALPQHTVLVVFRLENNNKEIIRSFNFQSEQVVLLEELVDDSSSLCKIETNLDMLSLVTEPFLDKVFWAPDTDPLYFSEEEITTIQQLADRSETIEIQKHVETAKGDEQSKIHLLETLQRPLVRYSCIRFSDRNDPKKNAVDGFSVLAGEHYVWILEIIDETENTVRVSKITLKDLNKKTESLFPFFLGD